MSNLFEINNNNYLGAGSGIVGVGGHYNESAIQDTNINQGALTH